MEKRIEDQLLDKAKEAFVLAIEIYNKPTIRYRLEGFSFFICNAWELMLKAHLIKRDGEASIYYRDKPERTISLIDCINKVFTNAKSPIHQNLIKISELRNTSTHFITEEYEMVYIPLLQACVFNFVEKMMEFHNVDMSEIIPENFITLSVRTGALEESVIRGKYPHQIAERLISTQQTLSEAVKESNSKFAIRVEHYYYNTKDPAQATETYHIAKEAEEGARVIRELKDPNTTHKFTAKSLIAEINKRIAKSGITLVDHKGVATQTEINRYDLQLFLRYFGLKQDERYCYVHTVGPTTYSYSMQAVDYIFNEIKKNPETILRDLKERLNKQEKS